MSSGVLGVGLSPEAFGVDCAFVAGPFGAGPWPGVSEAHTHEASSSAIPVRRADELFNNVNKSVLLTTRIGPTTLTIRQSKWPLVLV